MARKYSTTSSTSSYESVDSCFNEAFFMSSTNEISNTTLDVTENSTCTISGICPVSNVLTLGQTTTSEFSADETTVTTGFSGDEPTITTEFSGDETTITTEFPGEEPTMTTECSRDEPTMTSELPSMDVSPNFSEVSKLERIELRPRKRRRLLVESVENLTPDITSKDVKNAASLPYDTLEKPHRTSCEKVEAATRSNLEKSNLWPILMSLKKSIPTSKNNEEENCDQIVYDLYKSYNSDPLDFTEHLITIIEESSMLSLSGTSEASCSLQSIFGRTDSTRYLSLREFRSEKARVEFESPESFVNEETPGSSNGLDYFQEKRKQNTPMVRNPANKTYRKTPKFVGLPKGLEKGETTEKSLTSFDSEKAQESSNASDLFEQDSSIAGNRGKSTNGKTPKFRREIDEQEYSGYIADNGTLGGSISSKTFEKYYSIVSNLDDSSSLKIPKIVLTPDTPRKDQDCTVECSTQLEDNNDSETMTVTGTDTSKDETMNISKLASRHKEWVKTYENRDMFAHTKKLERRWQRELIKKREKCYNAISRLIEHATVATNEESQCTCEGCVSWTDFYNTITICDDYYTCTNGAVYQRSPSEPTVKKKRRSVSRSSRKSANSQSSSNSQVTFRPTRKVSRKSIGRKSPSRKSISPRPSLLVKSHVKSPFRSPRSRSRARPTSEIDRSSIRPVAQLRKIFSPGLRKQGSSMTTIPLVPHKIGPKTFVSKCLLSNSPSDKLPLNHKKFAHVKSPVGEYIRGTKVIKNKVAGSRNVN